MPALSPDGAQVAFRSDREGGGIFLMGALGESVRHLTDFGYNPAWSRMGAKSPSPRGKRSGVGRAPGRAGSGW